MAKKNKKTKDVFEALISKKLTKKIRQLMQTNIKVFSSCTLVRA
jgi:hypothetical protein